MAGSITPRAMLYLGELAVKRQLSQEQWGTLKTLVGCVKESGVRVTRDMVEGFARAVQEDKETGDVGTTV